MNYSLSDIPDKAERVLSEHGEGFFPWNYQGSFTWRPGLGWAVESLTLTTHSGTHLDAPYHYHPTMDRGKPSLTIDEIPLEWCFNDGVI
jgi:kynurenine formamidase